MEKKTLVISIIIILFFLLSFFIWHFFLSIYEVKYNTSLEGSTINCNSELTIKTIGINSFGWELPFRKIESKVKILERDELIVLSQYENSIVIKTLSTEGEFTIKIVPNLSLNPTKFKYKIVQF